MTDETVPSEADAHGVPAETAGPSMPTSQPVLLRALRWGLLATALLLVICGGIGYLIAGAPGLVGGVLGAGIAGVFFGLTIGSITFGNRFIENPNYLVLFFVIVAGGWILKFVLFIVAVLLLRNQPWLEPKILFFSLVAGVIVSLCIDAFIMLKSRIPIIGEAR
ncbi:MAG: 3-oxoacyl-ACP reductase [Actinobacteria bacterium]|nr:3-oxoacyl-ACP reductase [Actinomycetota bacterium]